MANLLQQADVTAQADITCTSGAGGICRLSQACSTYPGLWAYSLKVQFEGQTNYLNVPLGGFAANNATSGGCDLYVEYLDTATDVVFGAMFLQQYIAWWHYDYALDQTSLGLQLSTTNTLTGAYIGAGAYAAGTSPFVSNAGTVQNLQVTANSTTMRTTIKANLGY